MTAAMAPEVLWLAYGCAGGFLLLGAVAVAISLFRRRGRP